MVRRPARDAAASLRTGGLALAVEVATRFHLQGASKVQISADLGINRFKVARMLELAEASGLVQIVVGHPPDLDATTAARIAGEHSLRHCLVIGEAGPEDVADQRLRVSRVAAELLEQMVTADDVVGLAWGRTMSAVADGWRERAAATYVQLAGSLVRPDVTRNGPELISAFARMTGGTAVTFYAPLVVADAATARALGEDPAVATARTAMDGLTKAVVSVGSWEPGGSTVHDALSAQEQQELRDRGVVAEATGLLFDAEGRLVPDLDDRVLAVRGTQLRNAGQVIALAAGAEKAPATRAVLRSGLLTGLVTHARLARELL